MNALNRFLNTAFGAALLLAISIALVFNPYAKFPFKFIIIIAAVMLFAFMQEGSLRGLNFKKLTGKDIGILIMVFVGLEALMDFAVQPLVSYIFNEPADYSAFDSLKGNTPKYLKYLLYMWISAAVGEELLFRGFVFLQLEKIIGYKKYVIVFISALLFALPHWYQGVAGVVITLLFGLAFGFIYLRFKNIWINIIIHGLIDTLFLTLAYLGMTDFYN